MAKKAAKKEAPAAKAKKTTAKPAAKAPAKPAKAAKSAAKAAKPAPVSKAKEKEAKSVKAPAPKAVEKKAEKKVAPPAKTPKAEKKSKAEAVPVEAAVEAPKKEKKVKIDKTGLSEDQVKWHELHEKYKTVKAPAYSIAGQFEAKTPLQHKIFGWGFILSNEYDRLEVLFEDGKRMLISNRKLS